MLSSVAGSLGYEVELARDDECSEGECALNALQLHETALQQEEGQDDETEDDDSEILDDEVEDHDSESPYWWYFQNKQTGMCLSVGESNGHKKQEFLTVNTCGDKSLDQKFFLNRFKKLQVHMKHGYPRCVVFNKKGQLVLKKCKNSMASTQERWTWAVSGTPTGMSTGKEGMLSTASFHGDQVCIGIHGAYTKKGVLVGWGKCKEGDEGQTWLFVPRYVVADVVPGGHHSNHHHAHGVCKTWTAGTCSIFSCSSRRGPVDCVKGKCVCKSGACSDDGETCVKKR